MAAHKGRGVSHNALAIRTGRNVSLSADPLEKRDTYNGVLMTWYHINTGPDACTGKTHLDSDFFVAMNVPQYTSGGCCGKQLTIDYNGKSAVATCVDECASCPDVGQLDLTQGLFDYFAGDPGIGTFYGSWYYGTSMTKTTTSMKHTTPHTTSTSSVQKQTTTSTSTSQTHKTTSASSTSAASRSAPESSMPSASASAPGTATISGTALGGALTTPAPALSNLAQFNEALVNVLGVVVDAVQVAHP
ncbi:hypothetical protein B0H11DRAFT_2082390 [Mycena galericulata]|nr:hypothetical protein B0H11DRAFT_2082390 [Mycena galericulata]